MSETNEPTQLEINVLAPEVENFSVLLEGNYQIGHQVKAIGTDEQLKATYGDEVNTYTKRKLNQFLHEKNTDAYLKADKFQAGRKQNREYSEMLKKQFPIGSVVQLKSGGPKMTVHYFTEDYDENLTIHTVFYLDNRDFTEQKFTPEILKIAPEKTEKTAETAVS